MGLLNLSPGVVLNAMMKDYLDTLSEAEAKAVFNDYMASVGDSINMIINEAEAQATAIQTACNNVITQVPIIITQLTTVVTMIDPSAKVAQTTSITTAVQGLKVSLAQAYSALIQLNETLAAIGQGDNPFLKTISVAIESAQKLLGTIPL